jgi:hypothetical protein
MARKELYYIRFKGPDGFEVIKGDLDFNPTGTYHVDTSAKGCDCFASNKSTCRHRTMVRRWLSPERMTHETCTFREKMEANFWYEFDRDRWVKGID